MVSKLQPCASGSPVAATQWQHYNTHQLCSHHHHHHHLLICIFLARPSNFLSWHRRRFLAEKGWIFFSILFLCKLVSGYNHCQTELCFLDTAVLLQCSIKKKDDSVKHFSTVYLRWNISIHQRDLSFDSVNGWFPAAPQNC